MEAEPRQASRDWPPRRPITKRSHDEEFLFTIIRAAHCERLEQMLLDELYRHIRNARLSSVSALKSVPVRQASRARQRPAIVRRASG
jgi:hypothetical protein